MRVQKITYTYILYLYLYLYLHIIRIDVAPQWLDPRSRQRLSVRFPAGLARTNPRRRSMHQQTPELRRC